MIQVMLIKLLIFIDVPLLVLREVPHSALADIPPTRGGEIDSGLAPPADLPP